MLPLIVLEYPPTRGTRLKTKLTNERGFSALESQPQFLVQLFGGLRRKLKWKGWGHGVTGHFKTSQSGSNQNRRFEVLDSYQIH